MSTDLGGVANPIMMERLQDEPEYGDTERIQVAVQDKLDGLGDQVAVNEGLEAELNELRAVVNLSMLEA
eukprot:6019055-Alexandrium_andersonii.AAC.1